MTPRIADLLNARGSVVDCSYEREHAPYHRPHAQVERPGCAPHEGTERLVCTICHPPAAMLLGSANQADIVARDDGGIVTVGGRVVAAPAPEPDVEPAAAGPVAAVHLWTDGASSPKQQHGAGGWGFVLIAVDRRGRPVKRREGSGGTLDTTNNRMELQAVIEGLAVLTRRTRVFVHTDSEYVAHGYLEGRVERWKGGGWRRRVKGEGVQLIPNADLWQELDGVVARHDVNWQTCRGHGRNDSAEVNRLNGDADRLAVAAKERIKAGVGEAA